MNLDCLVRFVPAAVAGLVVAGAAPGQPATFPTKPITIVVPWPPGGTADVVARILAEKMTGDLGRSVIVENRAGANGTIGAQAVARAKPDGYTLLSISTTHTIVPTLEKDAPYDVSRTFAPVFGTSEVPQAVVVNGKSNIRSMADLIGIANATEGGIVYGSSGSGTLSHLTSARLVQGLKVRATHVPYKGLGPLNQAVLGGEVQFGTVNIPEALELTKSGALRMLGVTADQRLPYLPNVPTLLEQGLIPDLVAVSWTAFVAPANTPSEAIDLLSAAFAKAATDPAVQARVGKLGVVFKLKNGTELARFLQDQADRWRRVIEENRIKADH